MTLQATDQALMLTITTGTAGSQSPQPDPAASLGRYASTTPLAAGVVGGLFSTVTAAQAASGITLHRCIAVRNLSDAFSMISARIFLADPAGGGTYELGLDPVGIVAHNSAAVQGTQIATATTAPTGVTFSRPTNLAPLSIGTMAPNTVQLVWVRQIIGADTPGATEDPVTITVRSETA